MKPKIHVFEYDPRVNYGGGLTFALEGSPAYWSLMQDDDYVHLGTWDEFEAKVRELCASDRWYGEGSTGMQWVYIE